LGDGISEDVQYVQCLPEKKIPDDGYGGRNYSEEMNDTGERYFVGT
jgi:hypothetical protein